jgi:hypothetical protein
VRPVNATLTAWAMHNDPEFAEEYTSAERARFVAVGVAVGAAIVVAGKLWFFPWLGQFVASAPCRSVLGISGLAVLFYGLFVGLPLSSAILVSATVGRRGYKILKGNRVPPVGEKVFRTTRIERGAKATVFGYAHVLACTPLIALAIWGYFQAGELKGEIQHRPSNCTANMSIDLDPQQQGRLRRRC